MECLICKSILSVEMSINTHVLCEWKTEVGNKYYWSGFDYEEYESVHDGTD